MTGQNIVNLQHLAGVKKMRHWLRNKSVALGTRKKKSMASGVEEKKKRNGGSTEQ